MGTLGAGKLSGRPLPASAVSLIAIVACGLLACLGLTAGAAKAGAEQKLVTLDVPSKVIDPATQDFAPEVYPGMGPHPGTLKANVLLPDGYTPAKRYPLLLLFHGAGERYDSWNDAQLGDIQNTAKGLNAVIVMPEGAHGFYTDWWNGGARTNPGWEHYVREELLPLIQQKFSIRTERRYHAVAGFSMGGYGTYLTGSLLNGYFGTVVPLSAFASIRTPETQIAFSTASAGVPYDTVYGPPTAYYAEGHDPIEWGPNFRYSNLDVYTGDGTPDTAKRPQNATSEDTVSLILESYLKRQNDTTVQAIKDAGNTTIDYTVHAGSHHFEFWRPDLKSAIAKGLFNPVEEKPAKWEYVTSSKEGRAWDIDFRFADGQTQVSRFTRDGDTLSATGDGSVSLSDGNGCEYSETLPFTIQLEANPCRKLSVKTSGKLKAGQKRVIKVAVTGEGQFGTRGPVDAVKVKLGGKTALTNGLGKATIKVKAKRKVKKMTLVASKSGHKPAKKKLRVQKSRARR